MASDNPNPARKEGDVQWPKKVKVVRKKVVKVVKAVKVVEERVEGNGA